MLQKFLIITIAVMACGQAKANTFSQLSSGSKIGILSDISIPAHTTNLSLMSPNNTWLCWLLYDQAENARTLKQGRLFTVRSNSFAGNYFDQETYLVTLLDEKQKTSTLQVRCIESKISYLNSIYRGKLHFKMAQRPDFP